MCETTNGPGFCVFTASTPGAIKQRHTLEPRYPVSGRLTARTRVQDEGVFCCIFHSRHSHTPSPPSLCPDCIVLGLAEWVTPSRKRSFAVLGRFTGDTAASRPARRACRACWRTRAWRANGQTELRVLIGTGEIRGCVRQCWQVRSCISGFMPPRFIFSLLFSARHPPLLRSGTPFPDPPKRRFWGTNSLLSFLQLSIILPLFLKSVCVLDEQTC